MTIEKSLESIAHSLDQIGPITYEIYVKLKTINDDLDNRMKQLDLNYQLINKMVLPESSKSESVKPESVKPESVKPVSTPRQVEVNPTPPNAVMPEPPKDNDEEHAVIPEPSEDSDEQIKGYKSKQDDDPMSIEELNHKLQELVYIHFNNDPSPILGVLSRFGVQSLTELDPNKYSEVLELATQKATG